MTKILSLAAVLLLSACSSINPINWFTPHRMVIAQGNEVAESAVRQVKPGMTRNQVRFLLGTPLLTDPFHANRWDYTFLLERQGKPDESSKVTVVFDNDSVVSVEGRGLNEAKDASAPAGALPPATTASEAK